MNTDQKKHLASQFELAAKILHEDLEWEFSFDGKTWGKPSKKYITSIGHGSAMIRIKPMEHLRPPWAKDDSCLHNPDNLTPEQVGKGYRLLLPKEVDGRFGINGSAIAHIFNPPHGPWSNYCDGAGRECTYRVPSSVPWPEPPAKPDPAATIDHHAPLLSARVLTKSLLVAKAGLENASKFIQLHGSEDDAGLNHDALYHVEHCLASLAGKEDKP